MFVVVFAIESPSQFNNLTVFLLYSKTPNECAGETNFWSWKPHVFAA